mmetsp:Transcript_30168/g.54731  ORF Transcript_30168/g.54731 Transcript_30168/m.54731 type:complete len:268 (-) Transcript_30168:83-886(-)|eukprot:CAMPEP_0197629216 /NCGR_PEP_ID=MMETSP1338-20131121/7164_1 /TAXON_ID=43686 ORGANISM="Pelagodinium beii, Strain RCC1491" /NCGR_SAMPLE_ID=MMETSP1338 /ASSEMBLY_ACC=CAM_ASM_000754 /LENGTH=267 /DNA_ID=CAMNT_0043200239 /DNA_START=31 /DNA_END=834 /DNA_ORIENTATION=+
MSAPPSLDALFKSKAKKKVKPVNLNASAAADKASAEPVVKGPGAMLRPMGASGFAVAVASDEGWERALKKDEDLLKSCGLWMKEVEADGACLFRAFADQLSADQAEAPAQMRERCVDFMEAHREDFEPFLDEEFEAYCRKMRQNSTWGGQIEVRALAKLTGVNAVIYQPSEASGKPDNLLVTAVPMLVSEDTDARCVQLSFHPNHHAGQHYNSVRCSSDDGSGPAEAASFVELQRRVEDALKPKPQEAPSGGGYAGDTSKPKAKVFF